MDIRKFLNPITVPIGNSQNNIAMIIFYMALFLYLDLLFLLILRFHHSLTPDSYYSDNLYLTHWFLLNIFNQST